MHWRTQTYPAQLLQELHCEELACQIPFLDCITPKWHRDLCLFSRQLEEYSNEAHLSAVEAAIEFSKTSHQTNPQNQHESSNSEESYADHHNPKKPIIISNNFLNVLPNCLIIHWALQMFNDPKLCFCPCSIPNLGGI